MHKCLICRLDFHSFMSFGKMPCANGFLSVESFHQERYFDMIVGFCPNCFMVQLINQPERGEMFGSEYPFFSSSSQHMSIHFRQFAETVSDRFLKQSGNPLIVEIGSNDGTMLKYFHDKNIRNVGVEPSPNVAKVAQDRGLHTIIEFFDETIAQNIVTEHGLADALLGANILCHVPYIHSVIRGLKLLLKPNGVAIFEDPYLGDVIQNISYDQIYDEHVFLFSVHSIRYLFTIHNMELIDVSHQETHGGSMRYVVANKGARKVGKSVDEWLEKEVFLGLNRSETYLQFRNDCEIRKSELMKLLLKLKSSNRSIVGYAATSKSTTIINYCGISTSHLDYICDTTPVKQGKFSPGAHIPIRTHDEFRSNYPDYALLFAYNHKREIMNKEQEFTRQGGQWINYVPTITIT